MREERLIKIAPILTRKELWMDCEPGWERLIYDLFKELEKMIFKGALRGWWKDDEIPYIFYIGLKEGGLCIHIPHANYKMRLKKQRVEEKSLKTCEVCGKRGKCHSFLNTKWVRCKKCWHTLQDKYPTD